MKKDLLYCLQVYGAELDQATRLVSYLEELHASEVITVADCLLVYRRDCPAVPRLERVLSEIFQGFSTHRTSRREVGFPAGPNGVWCDTMHHLCTQSVRTGPHYSAVLTTEVDALPLCRDWPERLIAAWKREDKAVAGHWIPSGEHECGHINGNALFSPQILAKEACLVGCPEQNAWDTYFAPVFKRLGWADLPEIRSIYRKTELSQEEFAELVASKCVWLHGIKDNSAIAHARRLLVEEIS